MTRPDYVPADYTTVTPYICVRGARRVLKFVQDMFDADVLRTGDRPDGSLGHTELRIGDSLVMLSDKGDELPETTAAFYIYVADVDTTYRRALDAGATSIMEPADQEYGDRNAGIVDPAGNQWWIATPTRS